MPGLAPRLIAYGFLGAFCLVGPLFLLIALDSAVHRAVFIHTALRAEGTVIEMRPTHSSRTGAGTYIPVFRYTADDGQAYIVVSDVSVRRLSLSEGEQVRVLYQQGHPENARIDAFTPLWLYPLIFGIVGAAFSSIPALILVSRIRQRSGAHISESAEP
jgi:uncharacterized protein DUF3592